MIDFGIKDIVDILIVALLLYYVYRLMKKSGTLSLFYGVLAFIPRVWVLAYEIFRHEAHRLDCRQTVHEHRTDRCSVIPLFQDQIKRFLIDIGGPGNWETHPQDIQARQEQREGACGGDDGGLRRYVDVEIKDRRADSVPAQGALTDLSRRHGDEIDADINARLIENIFLEFAAPRRSDD